jgi:hypothetical protein
MNRLVRSLRRYFFLHAPSARSRHTDPRSGGSRQKLEVEYLEERTLLAVQFTPAPYATPPHRPNVPLGGISRFRPTVPMLAINGTDPGNIAVASHEVIKLTSDAGNSFPGARNFSPFFNSGGLTDVKFDGQGRLFWSNGVSASGGQQPGIYVDQVDQSPGGLVRPNRATTTNFDEKAFMAIDTNPGSPFFDNIYLTWTRNMGTSIAIFFSRSTDAAVTWSAPVQISAADEGFVFTSTVSVAPNGDVYVAYHSQTGFSSGFGDQGTPDGTSGQTFVVRSTDGGLTFPQKNLAFLPGQSDITFNIQGQPRTIPGAQLWTVGSSQPWVLADPTRPGNVYVVTADDPSNGAGAPYSRVVFSRSTDNGLTWSFPQTNGILAPVDGDAFQLFPTAAIDQFGDMVVAWYDNRRGLTTHTGRILLDVFATYSTDGGLTWATPFQVNDDDHFFDPGTGGITFGGPPSTTYSALYIGIALFGGTAHLAWTGNTFNPDFGNPLAQQVWFGSFALQGSLTVTGTAGADTIIVRNLAGNPDFVQVLVNGKSEYVGLWSGLTGITIAPTGGNDTIVVQSTASGTPVTLTGFGTTTLVGPNAPNTWNIAGTNAGTLTGTLLGSPVTFSSVQNLTGGTDTDTFIMADGQGITGNLDGGGGTNTLDESAYSTSVVVNLQTGAATGVGGAIAHIQNVKGGTGGVGAFNILVGDGGNILTGGDGRRNLLIAGVSATTLLGGNGDDILIGGITAYDTDLTALLNIINYWNGPDDYTTRVDKLMAGVGVPRLDATTVTSNGGGNTLTGHNGSSTDKNLYYGQLTDTIDRDPTMETLVMV